MSINLKKSPMWKYGAGKVWSLGLGMALPLVVFMAGCGETAKPTLTSIAPSSDVQGAAVALTLTGTNFAPGSTISLSGTGITVSNTTVVSSTSITATFTIAANAPTGAQNVTVTRGSKASASQIFTVNSGAPTLTSVNPSSGTQGQAAGVTLTGTLFTSGATVQAGVGITVSNTTVVSSTSITATFNIAQNAPTGPQNVTVTTSIGTSGSQTFTVNLLSPTVTSTNPANGATAVPINRKITAAFSKAMDPATITTATFTVASGTTNVSGIVTYDNLAGSNVATFTPAANLVANTAYTATITTGAKDHAGNPLASNFAWTFTTGAAVDATAPTVSSTNPANTAMGAALNQKITATFSKAMDSMTINATTFTLSQGTAAVAGTVIYSGTTATFTPTANLAASTAYTATITTGAKDLAGNALAGGGAAPNPWTFTTGTTLNTSAPTVTSTVPPDAATGVGINQAINATFSTGMDPATINTGTFTVTGPGTTTFVSGTVNYSAASNVATFAPASNLAPNVLYTATITTGARDLAGNPLAANKVWTFTTGATTTGQGQVKLASAANFAILAGSAVSNTGPTIINGDLGVSPGSATNGFPPGKVNGVQHLDPDPVVRQAKLDLTIAFLDASNRSTNVIIVPSGELGGSTLAPGLYKSGISSFAITSVDLTLDAGGDANAVWIFQMSSTLTVGNARKVILAGGAQPSNIFWAVGSSATIGTTAAFKGNILAQASITLQTGARLDGRALTQTAAVTLDSNVVTVPGPPCCP
jgi:hypothetical protein